MSVRQLLVFLALLITSVCPFLSIFFFFFKQKTAYEMRISDWSSDFVLFRSLVSVVMNENTSRGFDWSQFNFSFGAEPDTGTGTTPGTGLPGTGVPGTGTGTGSNTPKGSLFSFGNDALRIFNPAANILEIGRAQF